MRYLSDHIKLAERKKIVTFCNSQGKNDSISHLFKHFGWLYKKSKHTHTLTQHTQMWLMLNTLLSKAWWLTS